MRYVVVGGAGFMGSHLAEHLLGKGHQVRIVDLPGRAEEKIGFLLPRVEYVPGDYRDSALLRRAVQGANGVFHLASSSVPASAERDPASDVEESVIGSVKLLEACAASNVPKVVYVSSGGTVYGVPQALPVAETHPTAPVSVFGITRLAVEHCLRVFQASRGLDYAILRVANAYGERQNTRAQQGVIGVWMEKAWRGEDIEIWGDGEIVRDYVYVKDVAEALCRAMERRTSSKIFNIGSGQGHTLNEILGIIRSVSGRRLKVRYGPARPFDVPAIFLDVRRAREELDWSARTSLADGLARTWAWISSQSMPRT